MGEGLGLHSFEKGRDKMAVAVHEVQCFDAHQPFRCDQMFTLRVPEVNPTWILRMADGAATEGKLLEGWQLNGKKHCRRDPDAIQSQRVEPR